MKYSLVFLMSMMLATFGCVKGGGTPEDENGKKTEVTQAPPQLTPEDIKNLMEDAAKPGPEHARLQPLVGTWRTTSKFWMQPGTAPEVSKGFASNRWTLGKKFLKQDYSGKFGGVPFKGTGVLGYDKVKKSFISSWIDSMATGMMLGEGEFNPTTNEIIMKSAYSCPMTGGTRNSRTITRIISKNEHVFEMYDLAPDGSEVKTMEIVYKRASK